ncbi:MAG: YccF domain-containing protein [Enterococcus hirae]|nr:YccF domain-containing protein [Enterococcus hirae]
MRMLGNLIRFIFGGCIGGIGWFLAGVIWCITIIGIPFGKQSFKLAKLALMPFGTRIVLTRSYY